MKSIFKTFLLSFCILILESTVAFSKPDDKTTFAKNKLPLEELLFSEEELVITPTKFPITIAESPAVISVITEEQIKNMGVRDLADILRIVPRIEVSYADFRGVVSIRGRYDVYNSTSLLMIDGHPVNFFLFGDYPVDYELPIDDIKRLEVIRGPGSALYGANAFHGVINIITKTAEDISGLKMKWLLEDFDSQLLPSETNGMNLLYGKTFDNSKIFLSTTIFKTDGPKVFIEKDLNFDPITGNSKPHSGYTTPNERSTKSLSLKFSHSKIEFRARYVNYERYLPVNLLGELNDESIMDYSKGWYELSWENNISPKSYLKISTFYDMFKYNILWELFPEDWLPTIYSNGFIGHPVGTETRGGVKIENRCEISRSNKIILGAEVRHDELYNFNDSNNFTFHDPATGQGIWKENASVWLKDGRQKANVWAAYFDTDLHYRNIGINFGMRYDYHDTYEKTLNPRLGLVYQLQQDTILKLLYGKAFRSPSYYQLYTVNNPSEVGNENLDPEKIKTYEASISHIFSREFRGSVNFFVTDLSNGIILDTSVPKPFPFMNLATFKTNGLEIELETRFHNGVKSFLNYSFQAPHKNCTSQQYLSSNGKLLMVSKSKINFGFDIPLDKSNNLNFTMNYSSARPNPNKIDVNEQLSGHLLVNLTITRKVPSSPVETKLSIYNLFNQKYFDPWPLMSLPQQGRTYRVEQVFNF